MFSCDEPIYLEENSPSKSNYFLKYCYSMISSPFRTYINTRLSTDNTSSHRTLLLSSKSSEKLVTNRSDGISLGSFSYGWNGRRSNFFHILPDALKEILLCFCDQESLDRIIKLPEFSAFNQNYMFLRKWTECQIKTYSMVIYSRSQSQPKFISFDHLQSLSELIDKNKSLDLSQNNYQSWKWLINVCSQWICHHKNIQILYNKYPALAEIIFTSTLDEGVIDHLQKDYMLEVLFTIILTRNFKSHYGESLLMILMKHLNDFPNNNWNNDYENNIDPCENSILYDFYNFDHKNIAPDWNLLVDLLLEIGCDLEAENQHGRTALFNVIDLKNERLVEILLQKGIDPNHCDLLNYSPLMQAVRIGNMKIIQLLLNHRADIFIHSNTENTALIEGVKFPNMHVLKLLLNHICPVAQINHGYILDILDPNERDSTDISLLWISALETAVNIHSEQAVTLLIERFSSDPIFNTLGYLLIAAVCEHDYGIIKLLLDAGLSPDYENSKGWTPLNLSIQIGDKKSIDILLEKCDINFQISTGRTPLWTAVYKRDYEIIKKLLVRGANPNIKDQNGKTVFSFLEGSEDNKLLSLIMASSRYHKCKNAQINIACE